MSGKRRRAGITLIVFMVGTGLIAAMLAAFAFSLPEPGSDVQEQSKASGIGGATTASLPSFPIGDLVPTPEPPPTSAFRDPITKTAAALRIETNDCLTFAPGPGITKTPCGAPESAYRVIDRLPAGAACPSDTDRTHGQRIQGMGQAMLCLDIDWSIGACMELIPDNPKHIDCALTGHPDAVRVIDIKHNTIDVNACASADHGTVYDQRKFVVCLEQL